VTTETAEAMDATDPNRDSSFWPALRAAVEATAAAMFACSKESERQFLRETGPALVKELHRHWPENYR